MRPRKSDKLLLNATAFIANRKKQRIVMLLTVLKFILSCLAAVAVAGLLLLIPKFFVGAGESVQKMYKETGTIGDTFGGLLGPPIAFIAAILTFAAFYMQYQANKIQRESMREQTDNWLFERFESRFFELLKLHKDNVDEMEAGGLTGRSCFRYYYNELNAIYTVVGIAKREYLKVVPDAGELDVASIAYQLFFNGLTSRGERAFLMQSDDNIKNFYKHNNGLKALIDIMRSGDNRHQLTRNFPFSAEVVQEVRKPWFGIQETFGTSALFGHSDRLGHYYRHMYQTAKYVSDSDILTEDEKFEFLNTFRAQLSNNEQLMLFHNGYLWFPQEWKRLFINYRFIKNIPLERCDCGVDPTVVYEEEMILWYLKYNKAKLFEGQGDIFEKVSKWERETPEEERKRKLMLFGL